MHRSVVLALVVALASLLSGCAGVDYSPDGERLAVTWPLGKETRLAVIGVDGTGFKYLTSVESMIPKWAPDSRRIAFANDEGLWVIDADTGRASMIVADAGPLAAWSENARKVATFAKGPEGTEDIQVVWYDFDAKACGHPALKGAWASLHQIPRLRSG